MKRLARDGLLTEVFFSKGCHFLKNILPFRHPIPSWTELYQLCIMQFHYLFTFSHQTIFTPKPLSSHKALVAADFQSVFKSNHCFQHSILSSFTWCIISVQNRGESEGAYKRLKRHGIDVWVFMWEPANLGGLKRVRSPRSLMSLIFTCCHSPGGGNNRTTWNQWQTSVINASRIMSVIN